MTEPIDLSARQAAATRQGEAFEETAVLLLLAAGWQIIDRKWRHPTQNVEIDIVAQAPDGRRWWIECKGSWEGNRPGMARTDTAMKGIFSGWALSRAVDACPYMLITSHPPKQGSAGADWIADALAAGIVHEIRVVGFTTVRSASEEQEEGWTG